MFNRNLNTRKLETTALKLQFDLLSAAADVLDFVVVENIILSIVENSSCYKDRKYSKYFTRAECVYIQIC